MPDHRTPVVLETAADGRIVRLSGGVACIDDDVDGRQLMLMEAEGLPDQALDEIAADRVAHDAAGDRQTEAGSRAASAARVDREEGVG